MTELTVGNPEGDDHNGRDDRAPDYTSPHPEAKKRQRGKIPTVEDCLAALGQLPGLIVMGALNPAKSNAIRASYAEILRHLQKNDGRADGNRIANDDLVDLMRRDPATLNMLAPFLSAEQIEMIMKGAKDGDGGQA